jgi:hypothetical protein
MDKKTIIEELERELRMRHQVYPNLIRTGKLSLHLAQKRNQALQAAIDMIRGEKVTKSTQQNLFP